MVDLLERRKVLGSLGVLAIAGFGLYAGYKATFLASVAGTSPGSTTTNPSSRTTTTTVNFSSPTSIPAITNSSESSQSMSLAAMQAAEFFTTPYISNFKRVMKVIMGTFDASTKTCGYNYSIQLPEGGYTPEGFIDAGIVIDNGLQMSKSLDYWSIYFGYTPTSLYSSIRAWLNPQVVWLHSGTTKTTKSYSGLDRRELLLGFNVGQVFDTDSQVWFASKSTPTKYNGGQESHTMSDPLPAVVTALPTSPLNPTSNSNMETFAPKILNQHMQGNKSMAADMFAKVMSSVSGGDLSSPFGGGTTRDLALTLHVAKVTGLWSKYKSQLQSLINTFWTQQDPKTGGMPQTFPTHVGTNFTTPEPQGQTILWGDPNSPSWFESY